MRSRHVWICRERACGSACVLIFHEEDECPDPDSCPWPATYKRSSDACWEECTPEKALAILEGEMV
jgi:hypothetical protein